MRHATGDVTSFIDRLQTLDHHPFAPARGLFAPDTEVVVARAPGRLDVMGGIADYSGALVLQWPIREATCAAVQMHPERVLRIVSLSDTGASRHCTVPLDAIAPRRLASVLRGGARLVRRGSRTALGGLRRRGLAGARA